jgi:hypothetical protein
LEGKVQVMNRRWLAALVAAAFMITANAFEASALGSQSDDWLNFDQSGDSRGQTSRGQALAPEVEVQPEQGFPTLAKENVTAAKNAIKQYAEIVARGGWAAQPSGGFVGGIGDSLGFAQGGEVRQHRNDGGWVTETLPYDKWDTRTVPSFPSGGISRPIDIPRVSFASSDTFPSGYQSNPPASFAEGGQVRKYRDDGGWVTSSLGTVDPNWNWQPSVMYRAPSPHVSPSQDYINSKRPVAILLMRFARFTTARICKTIHRDGRARQKRSEERTGMSHPAVIQLRKRGNRRLASLWR